jgi:LmbE family N-acetylglucosaminyl deacetylase
MNPRYHRFSAWLLLLVGVTSPAIAASLRPMAPITAADSVLVVAPHPDDESLCCGGLIHRAREAGARVAIVWITSGEAFRWDAMVNYHVWFPDAGVFRSLAAMRMAEARKAASSLEVPADSLFFLGYPDGNVARLMGAYFQNGLPLYSSYSQATSVFYPGSFDPGAAYQGASLAADFAAILDRVKPTLVLAPGVQDSHSDHHGTALLVTRVLRQRGELGKLRYWIVHGGVGWPTGGFKPEAPQTVAPRGVGLHWTVLPLDAASVAAKLEAIAAHQSQMRVMSQKMRRYVRSTELYAPAN